MPLPIYVTGPYKYIDFSPGHVLINGQVVSINDNIRILDSQLTGAPGGSDPFGDYYVYIRPNRKPMEAYYTKNYEYILRSSTPVEFGGVQPAELPDELAVAKIRKRQESGVTVLYADYLNRTKRLIDARHITDNSITSTQIANNTLTRTQLSTGFSYSTPFGGSINTTLTHNLNSMDLISEVKEASYPFRKVLPSVEFIGVNQVRISVTTATPLPFQYRLTLINANF